MKDLRSLLAASLMSSITLFGDTIYFNNGAQLTGIITEQNSITLTINIDGSSTTYGMRDIERIENSNVSAPPPPPPPVVQNTDIITVGTVLHVVTTETVSTQSHKNGHQFRMQLESDLHVNDRLVAARGSDVYAKVISSTQAGRLAGKSSLIVTLSALMINGKRTSITSNELNILTQHNQARNTAGLVARGAAVGALANNSKGAKVGARVGAGAAVLTRGQAAGVGSGTLLDFRLTTDVKL